MNSIFQVTINFSSCLHNINFLGDGPFILVHCSKRWKRKLKKDPKNGTMQTPIYLHQTIISTTPKYPLSTNGDNMQGEEQIVLGTTCFLLVKFRHKLTSKIRNKNMNVANWPPYWDHSKTLNPKPPKLV